MRKLIIIALLPLIASSCVISGLKLNFDLSDSRLENKILVGSKKTNGTINYLEHKKLLVLSGIELKQLISISTNQIAAVQWNP
jgi:hypothetical protein